MKTIDEVIDELEDEGLFADALHYLKEYRKRLKQDLDDLQQKKYEIETNMKLDALLQKKPWENKGADGMMTWLEKLFRRKPKRNLREICYEKYGVDFVRKMDALCFGESIGNYQETVEFLHKLNEAKKALEV